MRRGTFSARLIAIVSILINLKHAHVRQAVPRVVPVPTTSARFRPRVPRTRPELHSSVPTIPPLPSAPINATVNSQIACLPVAVTQAVSTLAQIPCCDVLTTVHAMQTVLKAAQTATRISAFATIRKAIPSTFRVRKWQATTTQTVLHNVIMVISILALPLVTTSITVKSKSVPVGQNVQMGVPAPSTNVLRPQPP